MPADGLAPSPEEYRAYKERFKNWGRWGAVDELGTLNHITEDVRRAALALARDGRTYSLANPLATSKANPGHRNTSPAEHRVEIGAMGCSDYIGVSYHGFVNTHIDALCHIFTEDGLMYGGRPKSEVSNAGAAANAIDRVRGGIVTRGVLYDAPRFRGVDHVSLAEPVHAQELAAIAEAQDVKPRPGDATLVRMGATAFWAAHPDFQPVWAAPGLHASAMEFLFEHDAALLGWDLMEAGGQDAYAAPALPIHSVAIPYMGLTLLDNANFDELAEACAASKRYEFLLMIAPLVVTGGTGSPVNPIAVL